MQTTCEYYRKLKTKAKSKSSKVRFAVGTANNRNRQMQIKIMYKVSSVDSTYCRRSFFEDSGYLSFMS